MELSVPLTVMMNAIDGYSDVELAGWYLDRATGQLLCLWDAVAFVDDVALSEVLSSPKTSVQECQKTPQRTS